MPDIPNNEPTELRAGDTWQWTRDDLATDYPATTWTLTYRFKNAAGGFQIVATASGDAFSVTAAAATTVAYTAGEYAWAAQVVNGTTKHTIDSGTLKVLPDLFASSASTGSDQRTHARIVLDAIKAVIEGRASKDQEEYSIAGRSLKRTPITDLLKMRQLYEAEVRSEQATENLRNGLQGSRVVQVRF
jgi:hypothetical protein